MQRLQKAEQDLLEARRAVNRASDLSEEPFGEKSLKLDANRLGQMESQLVRLRQQLFEAKD